MPPDDKSRPGEKAASAKARLADPSIDDSRLSWDALWAEDGEPFLTLHTTPWPDPPCLRCRKPAPTGMCTPCFQAAMDDQQRADLLRLAELNTDSLSWAAVFYARAGIPVLALHPGSKLPATKHGVHDATTNTRFVRSWWRDHPDRNIGLAAGHVFDVIDVDVKASAPGMASVEKLRRAGLLQGVWGKATTPSGGLHLLVAPNGGGNHGAGDFGIDYRGRNGYIVAGPSTLPEGAYRWEAVDPDRRGQTFDWQAGQGALGVIQRPPRSPQPTGTRNPNGLIRTVANAAELTRNDKLYWAARRATDDGIDVEVLREAARLAGLPDSEITKTSRSAAKAGAA